MYGGIKMKRQYFITKEPKQERKKDFVCQPQKVRKSD